MCLVIFFEETHVLTASDVFKISAGTSWGTSFGSRESTYLFSQSGSHWRRFPLYVQSGISSAMQKIMSLDDGFSNASDVEMA